MYLFPIGWVKKKQHIIFFDRVICLSVVCNVHDITQRLTLQLFCCFISHFIWSIIILDLTVLINQNTSVAHFTTSNVCYIPSLAKPATNTHNATRYSVFTWCHLNVTMGIPVEPEPWPCLLWLVLESEFWCFSASSPCTPVTPEMRLQISSTDPNSQICTCPQRRIWSYK